MDLSSMRADVNKDLQRWNPHPTHVPLASELLDTMALIQHDDGLISSLQDSIRRVEATLADLQEQVSLVRRARLNKVAFISPCRKIPFEILGEIFALSMENLQSYSRVCRKWNEVCKKTSKLWNHLKISLMDHTQRFKGEKRLTGRWQKANTAVKLRDCLVRAGQTDELHVHLGVLNAPREIQEDDREMVEMLRTTLPRWTTVSLHFNRRENILQGLDQWISLRSLSINFLRPVDTKSFDGLFQAIDNSADKLRILHLSNDSREPALSFPNIFPRLTSLTLQDCSTRILAYVKWDDLHHLVLIHCTSGLKDLTPSPFTDVITFPTLKTLTIHKTSTEILRFTFPQLQELSVSDSEITLTSSVTLSELETLELQLHASQMSLLSHLNTPKLKSFELKQLDPGDLSVSPPSGSLTSFFKTIAKGGGDDVYALLRFLSISDVIIDPEIFESILRGCPELTTVRIVPLLLSSAQKLQWLKEKRADGSPVAPNLEELKIRILPHSLVGKEEAEISLKQDLERISEERSASPRPFSVRIFRNIVK